MEFAFVVPLLAMFLFGIVQFGIAYDKQQSINSAAREGARLGALRTSTLSDVATRAVDAYGASAVPGNDPTVEVFDDLDNLHGSRQSNGSFTGTANDAEAMPCGEDPDRDDADPATPSDFIKVRVSTPYDITIPFFGVQQVTIDAEAEFRCE